MSAQGNETEAVLAALRTKGIDARAVNCDVIGTYADSVEDVRDVVPDGWSTVETNAGVALEREAGR